MDSARKIKVLTECGAITAALKAEHYAIEDALQTLDEAMRAGAKPDVLTQIMDMVVEFCVAHFTDEQQMLRDHRYAGLAAHTRAHAHMLLDFRAVRDAIGDGHLEAPLNASDLLYAFHDHISRFDRPAHAHLLREQVDVGGDTLQQETELGQLYRVKHAAAGK